MTLPGSPEGKRCSGADVAQQMPREPGTAETAMPESGASGDRRNRDDGRRNRSRTPIIRRSPSPARGPVCASSPSRPRPGAGSSSSGEADAQAAIRLYLNDTLVARAEADDAGDVSFAIRRGVRAGRYSGSELGRNRRSTRPARCCHAPRSDSPSPKRWRRRQPEPQPALRCRSARADASHDGQAQGADPVTPSEATEAEIAEAQTPRRASRRKRKPGRIRRRAAGPATEAESPPEAPATVAERPRSDGGRSGIVHRLGRARRQSVAHQPAGLWARHPLYRDLRSQSGSDPQSGPDLSGPGLRVDRRMRRRRRMARKRRPPAAQ